MLHIAYTVKNSPSKKIALKSAVFFDTCMKRVMGKDYELSLVFIGDKRCRTLNRKHRKIDKPTDILSFPLDKKTGEIFIALPYSVKKAKLFDRKFDNYLKFIFVHGLFHLKGYDHSSKMEREEMKIRKEFGI